MPDVANALKFQKKLLSVETAYLKQIDIYRRDSRRALLEIVERGGASRPAVSLMQKEIDSLSRKISSVGNNTSREIRTTVANYTRKQLQLAKRAGLAATDSLAPVLNAGAPAAKDGQESYMTNTSAWINQLETSLQVQSAKLRISKATPEEITDRLLSETLADGRASVWAAAGNQAQTEETGNVWAYGVGLLGAYISIFNEQSLATVEYKKQAIATIDERTTDCCLRVHGQIQEVDAPFTLDGTPRFADEIQDPPFHWYCRTSEALYHEEFENFGIPTEEMEDAAAEEIKAREKGREVIYPSHATARRSS